MGIKQRDAEAKFPQGRDEGGGFGVEYHVGGELEVGESMTRKVFMG